MRTEFLKKIVATVFAGLMAGALPADIALAATMPVPQQNALVQRYCAVCHTDAARNGGLTLEHFDAATAAPSLAAMLTSKLKGGAMGAAGLPVPDKATIYGLIDALASRAADADKWHLETGPVATASILRELPRPSEANQGSLYRLVVTCNAAERRGDIQLAWSPVPKRGSFTSLADGKTSLTHEAKGSETMGNGSKVEAGPAALSLFTSQTLPALPAQTLRISGLFPRETVEFPFRELSGTALVAMSACFNAGT